MLTDHIGMDTRGVHREMAAQMRFETQAVECRTGREYKIVSRIMPGDIDERVWRVG